MNETCPRCGGKLQWEAGDPGSRDYPPTPATVECQSCDWHGLAPREHQPTPAEIRSYKAACAAEVD